MFTWQNELQTLLLPGLKDRIWKPICEELVTIFSMVDTSRSLGPSVQAPPDGSVEQSRILDDLMSVEALEGQPALPLPTSSAEDEELQSIIESMMATVSESSAVVPPFGPRRTSMTQSRSFAIVGPNSWNQLLQSLRTDLFSISFDQFRKRLKTSLYQ